jgi:site-specific DNA-methyltransferase (adenine-specific)/modification methylase
MLPAAWDNAPVDRLADLIELGRVRCVWGGNYYVLPPSRGWLSWFKPDAPPSMGSVEFAWTNLDRNARQIAHSISATNGERLGHPTQKPLPVMLWTLAQIGRPASVLDPFMGSGTTGVAALAAGGEFIGVEIEPRYFEMACERIENAQRQERLFA